MEKHFYIPSHDKSHVQLGFYLPKFRYISVMGNEKVKATNIRLDFFSVKIDRMNINITNEKTKSFGLLITVLNFAFIFSVVKRYE